MNDLSLAVTTFGWHPLTTFLIWIVSALILSIVFFIVISSSRLSVIPFAKKKKYHLEAIWSVFVISVLVWLYVSTFQWTPPATFSEVKGSSGDMQVVNITAGQWFWLMKKVDTSSTNDSSQKIGNPMMSNSFAPPVTVKQNQPVKFIATSIDVNHGFGIFSGPQDGSPILLQMQVIPGIQNVFYYTFKESGDYNIRCLEYCGYAHPYMTSRIHVVPDNINNVAFNIGGSTK